MIISKKTNRFYLIKNNFKFLIIFGISIFCAFIFIYNIKSVQANKKLIKILKNQESQILKNQETQTKILTDLVEVERRSMSSVFDYYAVSKNEKYELASYSKSQISQDIFVYLESNKKKNGFFVEFGATDGISLSNTYMLEQKFGWRGILAEPALVWHKNLKDNRPNSIIETLCVWKNTGSKLIFNETDTAELSTIDKYSAVDNHFKAREEGHKYEVSTISLFDLLKKNNAPQYVDYLSIDTEGSEFQILEAFFKDNDFYKIKIITCEHNFTANREQIYQLIIKHGYQRMYPNISQFDDFYVLKQD